MRRRSAAAAAIVATPCFAANVVYHSSSTGYEDGRPGLDPDANTACETGLCAGGARNGMSCSLDSDCPHIPDGIVEWPTGVVHVIDCRERSAGASQKSFSPIPANLTIDANPADGLAVMQQILAPLVDDIPFDDPEFPGFAPLGSARAALAGEGSTLIPLNAIPSGIRRAYTTARLTMNTEPADLPRTTLQLIALGLLIATSLWIVTPFLPAIAWAATIVVATWPILLQVEAFAGGRRGIAVAVMTGALLLLLVVPLFFAIDAIVGHSDVVVDWAKSLDNAAIPQPPGWLASIPVFGSRLAERWHEAATMPPDQFAAMLVPYAQGAAVWMVHQIGGLGMLVVQFLLTVVVCALLYANGEKAAGAVDRIASKLAGEQGHDSLVLAGQAIRGVALGVVVTAMLQTTLIAAGLNVVGVPYASIIVAATFVLCVAQIGPLPILIPTVIWVWSTMGDVWGVGYLIWSAFCGLLDNFVRPVLIRRGADLPIVLIFTGVIGGLIAMGVIGLFVGPVVLAVAYTLLFNWVDSEHARPPRA